MLPCCHVAYSTFPARSAYTILVLLLYVRVMCHVSCVTYFLIGRWSSARSNKSVWLWQLLSTLASLGTAGCTSSIGTGCPPDCERWVILSLSMSLQAPHYDSVYFVYACDRYRYTVLCNPAARSHCSAQRQRNAQRPSLSRLVDDFMRRWTPPCLVAVWPCRALWFLLLHLIL